MRRRRINLKVADPDFEKDLDRRFKDAETLLDEVSGHYILAGILISDVLLEDGIPRQIQHGLGRKWRGWRYANLEGATSSGRIQHVKGEDASRYLQLQADGYGATITVTLEIF